MRQRRAHSSAAGSNRTRSKRPALAVVLALVLLVLAGLMGGSSRPDTVSLLLLRPVSVAIAAWALVGLTREQRAGFNDWLILFASVIALLLVHLVPLPPGLWHSLPGRDLVVAIDAATGLNPWRPLSLDPQLTRNALWSLAAPAGALLLALRVDRRGGQTIFHAVLAAGLVSGLLGVVQFASGPDSPLYWYRITNFTSAVGLFANRNHAGVFLACQFPLLAAFAVTGAQDGARQTRMIVAAAIAAVLVPMILTTGSRAGLLAGVIGLLGAAMLVRPHVTLLAKGRRSRPSRGLLIGALIAGFLVFCALYIGLNQGNSLDRIVGGADSQTELRWPIWRATLAAAKDVFPWGSGVGAFTSVFDIYEPDSILGPSYVNHAHNDYLEVLLGGGIPGVLLLIAALWLIARDGWRVWRATASDSAVVMGRAAFIALMQLSLASAFDYPLRTSLMAVFAAFLVVWLRRGALAAVPASAGSRFAPNSR